MSHKASEVRTYLIIYLLLLLLLAVTVAAAQFEVGAWNIGVTLTIASAKAVLIVLFFMHVKQGAPLVKLVVIIGLFWMAILFSLTLSDYWSRKWDPQINVSERTLAPT